MKQYLLCLLIIAKTLSSLFGSAFDGYESDTDMSPRIRSISLDGDEEEIIPYNSLKAQPKEDDVSNTFAELSHDLLELAYAIPALRHEVRDIVTKKWQAPRKDSTILAMAWDIIQWNGVILRSKTRSFVEKILKKPCQDSRILMVALHMEEFRLNIVSIIDNALRQDFNIANYNPAILWLAYHVPDYLPLVEARVEAIFANKQDPEPEILQIALCMPQLKEKALNKAIALLPEKIQELYRARIQKLYKARVLLSAKIKKF